MDAGTLELMEVIMSTTNTIQSSTLGVMPASATGSRRVLFACPDMHWPASALLRAGVLAEGLRDELFVLQVCAPPRTNWRQRHRPDPLFALRRVENLERTRGAAIARCATLLWPTVPDERILSSEGDFVDAVVQSAAELGVELIVLPPQCHDCGNTATRIVASARVPVLVARPGRSHNVVVAATNLADRRYPVLRQARSFGALLHADLLLVHNVVPSFVSLSPETAMLWLAGPPSLQAQLMQRRLAQAAEGLSRCVGTVVKTEPNTVHAILDAARQCDADLIVVGVTRSYSRWQRLWGHGVAARVTQQAQRSVLLFPVAPPSSESTAQAAA